MGIGDRAFGRDPQTDQQALERYRYMLRTAPPGLIEQAHAEAFARLTPAQRRLVLEQLQRETPEGERTAGAIQGRAADDPAALARLATRAEVRQPGTIERMFGGGGGGGGMGFGGLMAGAFLGSLAGNVIGSMVAQQFFAHAAGAEAAPAESVADRGDDETNDEANDDADDMDADSDDFDGGGDIDV